MGEPGASMPMFPNSTNAVTFLVATVLAALVILAAMFAQLSAGTSGDLGAVLLHCPPNQAQQVDPILSFGVARSAHLHTPAGADAFSATSTLSQMQAAVTTCVVRSDHSMLWIPTPMTSTGTPATILDFAYYLRTNGPVVSVPPNGLQVIGGQSGCAGSTCTLPVYLCTRPDGTGLLSHTIPTASQCAAGQGYTMQVQSGQCWDATHLGPGMGVADTNTLPVSSMTPCAGKAVPMVVVSVRVAPDGLGGWLSSDVLNGTEHTFPGDTGHFDYAVGWASPALSLVVSDCLNTAAYAGKTSCVEVKQPDGSSRIFMEKADHSGPDLTELVTG